VLNFFDCAILKVDEPGFLSIVIHVMKVAIGENELFVEVLGHLVPHLFVDISIFH